MTDDSPLTPAQAAEHLGISLQAVYVLNSRPNDFPPPTYTGRTPTWSRAALDAWRAAHPAKRRRHTSSGPPPARSRPTRRFHSLEARLAFATDGGRALLTDGLLLVSERAVREAAAESGAEVAEFIGSADHIQLVIRYPAKQSIAHLARRLRIVTAHAVRHQADFVEAEDRIRIWSPSYYASSAAAGSMADVAEYVRQQEQDVNN